MTRTAVSVAALSLLALAAVPSYAVEPPASVPSAGAGTFSAAEEPDDTEDHEESPSITSSHPALTASAWCAVRERGDLAEHEPGCDQGLAASLYRRGRLALVGASGTETVGLGAAWVVWSGDGPVVAVAVGAVAPYDGEGVYPREWAPALGVTVSWWRGR